MAPSRLPHRRNANHLRTLDAIKPGNKLVIILLCNTLNEKLIELIRGQLFYQNDNTTFSISLDLHHVIHRVQFNGIVEHAIYHYGDWP